MLSVVKTITAHDFRKMLNTEYRDEAGNLIIQDIYVHHVALVEINGNFYKILAEDAPLPGEKK